jgi:hypothetical protein
MVENYQYQSSNSFYHTLIAPLVKLKKIEFFFFCKLLEKLKKKKENLIIL